MEDLRDKGNTLVVVEHEEAVIRAADHLVDIGPGRGEGGGELIFSGSPAKIASTKRQSLTGAYLSGSKNPSLGPRSGAAGRSAGQQLKITAAASQHNLRDIDVAIPLGAILLRHRGVRVWQIHARPQSPLRKPVTSSPARPATKRTRRVANRSRVRAENRPGRDGRPIPAVAHAAVDARRLHRGIRADPQTLRRHGRGQGRLA